MAALLPEHFPAGKRKVPLDFPSTWWAEFAGGALSGTAAGAEAVLFETWETTFRPPQNSAPPREGASRKDTGGELR